jgi:hypothetical protein
MIKGRSVFSKTHGKGWSMRVKASTIANGFVTKFNHNVNSKNNSNLKTINAAMGQLVKIVAPIFPCQGISTLIKKVIDNSQKYF